MSDCYLYYKRLLFVLHIFQKELGKYEKTQQIQEFVGFL